MTDVSTTCAVVIFRVKVSCITSTDGIKLWLMTRLVNYFAILLVVCRLIRDLIGYLTIIPRARMGSESIAHQGERNNCFSKIQLVSQKYSDKTTLASKT